MKELWIIKLDHTVWSGGVAYKVPYIYGKGEASILAKDVTDDWLRRNAYGSIAAAKRGLYVVPWRKHNAWSNYGAVIESVFVPETKYQYKLYRCYEIVVLDENGNQVNETRYCYGSKQEAEEIGAQEVAWAEERQAAQDAHNGTQEAKRQPQPDRIY